MTTTPHAHGGVYVIYNPAKVARLHRLKRLVRSFCLETNAGEPTWLPTSVTDPGTGQAARAVAAGASLVLAAGGDGTVRAVAAGVANTDVPLAILPYGTGNLLGRNIGIPPDDVAEAVEIAFYGYNSHADISWLRIERGDEPPVLLPEGRLLPESHLQMLRARDVTPPAANEYPFLVIAGQGWDAELFAGTDTRLKKHMGWGAYVVAGARTLKVPNIKTLVELDGHRRYRVTGRSILFANCSQLMAGITLVPGAQINDGLIDVTVFATQSGLIGWLDLFSKIAAQGVGIKQSYLPGTDGRLDFRRARTISTRTRKPRLTQVDGDTIGKARDVFVRIDKQALTLRHG
ncbi:diacylglycerol kinase family protein [Gleimia hominis]|uniref:Diacylglycerol kinase family protein n=1 Tax=Gleimia hominis TaxID=595468 RepID=A0ABU3I960_9ACTO|nr:diacylglycerol kinase family protein [Gleimia hominis]MDT3766901.1 diacylglycerol kinase family protein [Gleimia hominis]